MAEACVLNASFARKQHSILLQQLSLVGQRAVAEALEMSEATVSRMKTEDLERFSGFIAVLGLKLVKQQSVCYAPEHITHLEYFAKLGLARAGDAPTLEWGDE